MSPLKDKREKKNFLEKIKNATPTAALGIAKKIKLKIEKKNPFFFENGNLKILKNYADGFTVGTD